MAVANVDQQSFFEDLGSQLRTTARARPQPGPKHTCHATGCTTAVAPRLLMCSRHWRMVPKHLQEQVWRTYRQGQEVDKQPSDAYLDAAQAAIDYVAAQEGRR